MCGLDYFEVKLICFNLSVVAQGEWLDLVINLLGQMVSVEVPLCHYSSLTDKSVIQQLFSFVYSKKSFR